MFAGNSIFVPKSICIRTKMYCPSTEVILPLQAKIQMHRVAYPPPAKGQSSRNLSG